MHDAGIGLFGLQLAVAESDRVEADFEAPVQEHLSEARASAVVQPAGGAIRVLYGGEEDEAIRFTSQASEVSNHVIVVLRVV